mgnify:CR=1 FL=1|jgi:hypothetical protein|tara:strand:+ start:1159 stop:1383 length:225 start_codon:yes stop_codon:yes gene_type:complete
MSETEEEMLGVLKALVERIQSLEKTVYHQDNLLMKSGFVVAQSPTPSMTNSVMPTGDTIHKMSWDDIEKFVNGR